VKLIRFLVVGILLFNLGITLGADLFGKEPHVALTSEEVNDYRKHNLHEAGHSNLGCDSKAPEKSHCPDPCHLGQPHFGHTAFLGSTSSLSYALFNTEVPTFASERSIVDGPFLEGPRRPPKHA
jgi:hypothetical protein